MKNNLLTFVLLPVFLLWSTVMFAQPANDLCANATVLACGDSLPGEDTTGSTDQSADITCGMGTGAWYAYTSTMGDDVTIAITNDAFDVEVGVASGACGGLTNISCTDGGTIAENVTFSTVAGTTYYIYIGDWSTGGTDAGTFDLAISCVPPPLPPVNDDCADAIPVATEAATCTGTTAGSTAGGATESLPGCLGTADDDVWFSFVASGPTHVIDITNTGGTTDIVTEVFDGCGGASLACQDTPNSPITVTGLTPGATYFYRVYSWSATTTNTTDFTTCVGTPPPPPANDLCADAVVLACGDSLPGEDTAGATDQSGDVGCGMGAGGWYSFAGTGDNVTIDITNDSYDVEVAIASGACGGLTNISCTDGGTTAESVTFPTVAGTDYYIYVGDFATGGNDTGTFDLAISCVPPPPPPPNDECMDAVMVDVADGCTGTAGYTEGGTESLPGCVGTADDDVWYSFVATTSTHYIDVTNTGGSTDIVTEVFDGCPAGGASLICQDTPNSPTIITGLTLGNTYYYRIYTWSGIAGTDTEFTTCVNEPPPPEEGKDCLAAVPLCCGAPIPPPTEGVGNYDEAIPNDCSTALDEDNSSWVSISVTQAGCISMNFDAMPDADIDFGAWLIPSPDGTPVTLADGCAALTADGTGGVIDRCDYNFSTTASGFGNACPAGDTGCDDDPAPDGGCIMVNPGDLLIVMVDDFSTFDDLAFQADVQFEDGADATCPPPVVTIEDAVCSDDCGADTGMVTGGTITIDNCSSEATMTEYSIDGGTTWTAGMPPYDMTTAYTGDGGANPMIVRCNDAAGTCPSAPAAVVTTLPTCTPCVNCPATQEVNGMAATVCGAVTTEVSDWQTAVATTDGTGAVTVAAIAPTTTTIVYSATSGYVVPDFPSSGWDAVPSGMWNGNVCDSDIQTWYAYVICDLTGDGETADDMVTEVGSIEITIFPDLSAFTITDDGATCGPQVTAWDCSTDPAFTIVNDYDGNGDSPDFSGETGAGTVTFTVTNSNYTGADAACQSFSLAVPYNCSACPDVNTLTDGDGAVCAGGGIDDLATWQADVATANPLDATQDPSAWGSIVYSSVAPTNGSTSHDGILPDGNITSPACAAVDQVVMAYLLCDEDGMDNTGDELYQLISTYTLSVYPMPDVTNAVGGTCTDAVMDNCGGLTIMYTPGGTMAPSLSPGDADLDVNWTATIAGAPAGCETTGMYTLSCPMNNPPIDVTLSNPCDCANGIDLDNDGTNDLAEEEITITPGTAPYTSTLGGNLVDASNNPLTGADIDALIAAADPGTGASFTITVYITADGTTTYTLDVTDDAGSMDSITGGPCDCFVDPGCGAEAGTLNCCGG